MRILRESSARSWVIAALAVVVAISLLWGGSKDRQSRADRREIERIRVEEIPGIVTAHDGELKVVNGKLREMIAQLEEAVPDAEVVETIRTVANPINVDLRDLALRRGAELKHWKAEHARLIAEARDRLAIERPDCEGLIRPEDCPPPTLPEIAFRFHVATEEVRLASDAGNTFAAGHNWIYEGDCEMEDGWPVESEACQEAGSAPWSADLSELLSAPREARAARLGWYVGVQYAVWADSATASADCQASPHCTPSSASVSLGRFRLAAGPEWRFKRVGLRVGGFLEESAAGVDLGWSWHRNR